LFVFHSEGNFVILPSRLLATAVAGEWERQGQLLKPTSMPLFSLTSSAIDGFSDPVIRENNKAILHNYICTDTACYRSPSLNRLAERQDRVLNPLLDWVESEFGAKLNTTYTFEPVQHPEESIQILKDQLDTMDCWDLAVFDSLTKITKSYVIALATVKGKLSAQQAFINSRVEEELQIQTWGEVEGGHDIDSSYTKVKVFAATVFQRLINQ
jgi:ATP synthase F1 complex assembly factor 2